MDRQAKRKRANMAGLKLVVAGCVAAQEGAALLRRVPELDLVMGPHHANRCPQTLRVNPSILEDSLQLQSRVATCAATSTHCALLARW